MSARKYFSQIAVAALFTVTAVAQDVSTKEQEKNKAIIYKY